MKDIHSSIIIRADDSEREFVPMIIERLLRQKAPGAFEIILMDLSREEAPFLLPNDPRVITVKPLLEKFSYGRPLNIGAASAKGEFLIYLNGHVIPIGDDWLTEMTKPFENPKIAAVCGLQNCIGQNLNELDGRLLTEFKPRNRAWASGLASVNLATRREVWQKFPFNETIPGAEDKEWGIRLLKAGHYIMLGVPALVWHRHPERTWRQELPRHRLNGFICRRLGVVPRPRLGNCLSRIIRCWGRRTLAFGFGVLRDAMKNMAWYRAEKAADREGNREQWNGALQARQKERELRRRQRCQP